MFNSQTELLNGQSCTGSIRCAAWLLFDCVDVCVEMEKEGMEYVAQHGESIEEIICCNYCDVCHY